MNAFCCHTYFTRDFDLEGLFICDIMVVHSALISSFLNTRAGIDDIVILKGT
jgi:hypothetical protein